MTRLARSSVGALTMLLACSGEPGTVSSGVDLEVRYDSSLQVHGFTVLSTPQVGQPKREELEPPLDLDPPGVRAPRFSITGEPGRARIHVDARSANDVIVGSGEVDVLIEPSKMVPAVVTLGRPSPCPTTGCPRCGNGRPEGTELCDDGNQDDTDACKSDCTPTAPQIWTYELELAGPFNTSLDTLTPIPGSTLSFTPGADERWLVFMSGRVTSTSEAILSSEVVLLVNGEPSATFGHQTFGGGDGWAGFVVFDLVENASQVAISPRFRAIVGETQIADLRLVAARVPPGAEVQVARGQYSQEITGTDVELARLDLSPTVLGRYLILAAAGLSEAPGGDTAQLWLTDDTGRRYPDDSRGVGFANGRGAMLPTFVAIEQNVGARVSLSLRGTSSGTGGDAWWNEAWLRRLPITIASDFDLPAGAQVSFVFDHQALIALGAQADGKDLRIVDAVDGVELDRVPDDDVGLGRTDSRIWFRIRRAIAANEGPTDYHLYYGNAAAGPPPADPQAVFDFYDDFSGQLLDRRWAPSDTAVLQNGRLLLGPRTIVAPLHTLEDGNLIEARIRYNVTNLQENEAVALGVSAEGGLTEVFTIGLNNGAHQATVLGVATDYQPTAPDQFQRYRIARRGGQVILYQAFTEIGRGTPLLAGPLQIGMAAILGAELEVEWIRGRVSRARDATLTLGPVEARFGTSPSTYAYPKILALSLDAFPAALTRFDPDIASTTAPDFTPMSTLDVPAPPAESDHLVIQALRVAGDSDAAGRKSGIIRVDDQPVFSTSHRINRDATAWAGYHHVAGLVDVRRTSAPTRYSNGIASPDGITVEGAASSIIVLRYPAP